MSTILISGANKGLGYEAARRLLAQGHTVFIGARDRDRGLVAAEALRTTFVQLDVTDDASVQEAVATVQRREGHLDVLINNAGISGGMVGPEAVTAAIMEQTFAINVFGIVRLTQAFLPLLRKSKAPVIVNVSSGLGSFATVLDPSTIEPTVLAAHYTASKAAVNMLTVQYATDLNHHSGPQTVTEGTDAIVKMATINKDGPTGTFVNRHGPLAW